MPPLPGRQAPAPAPVLPVPAYPQAKPPAATPAARGSRYRVSEAGDISLNYVDTDVREIARLILGEILKVNYSVDPGFQGMVTIQTARAPSGAMN